MANLFYMALSIPYREGKRIRLPGSVIIPQFIPKKGWHNFLHNQSSLLIRAHLLYRRDVIITTVPYHFKNRGLFFCALYKESAPPTTKAAIIRSLLKGWVHRSYFPLFEYCQTYGIKKHLYAE